MPARLPYRHAAETRSIQISGSPIGQPWPIVYGRTKVACPIVHLHLLSATLLELAAVVSLGEIDAIETVYVGGTNVYPSTKPWCRLELFTGSLTQSPSTILRHPDWITALPGVAYIAMQLHLGQAPIGGMPDVSAVVRGRKCSPSGTYTTNPAFFLKDLLQDTWYGAGLRLASDWDTVASSVTISASAVVRNRSSISVDDDDIRSLLTAMHGRLVYDGSYALRLDSAASNAGTVSASGPIRLVEEPALKASIAQYPNAVRARYMDATPWREHEVRVETAGAQTQSEAIRQLDLGLLPVGTYQDAVRIAKTALNRARAAASRLKLICDYSAQDLRPGQRVTLSHAVLGSRELLIDDVIAHPDGRYELQCIPWSASDFDSGTYTAPAETGGMTTQAAELYVLRDDFTSGGTTSGAVGETGWLISGSPAISYPTEAGRFGICKVMGEISGIYHQITPSSGQAFSLRVVLKPESVSNWKLKFGGIAVSVNKGIPGTAQVETSSGTVICALSGYTSGWVDAVISSDGSTVTATIASGSLTVSGSATWTTAASRLELTNTMGFYGVFVDLIELALPR